MNQIIVGIDPGSRITGFGVLVKNHQSIVHLTHGVILLNDKNKSFSQRMYELGQGLSEIFAKYRPDTVVIENIFLGKNIDSAFKLGHARGVIMYQAGVVGAEVFEYATRKVKKGITGSGAAEKEQVRLILEKLLGLQQIQKIDASDALAMAYYHASILSFQKKIKELET